MFAKVLLDDSGGRAFDYEVPSGLNAVVGSRVRVPVRMRTLLGTVIAVSETTEAEGVRPISELVGDEPALNAGLIQLANWMADYYCCPLEAAMRTVLPNVIRKAEVGHKVRLFAKLARSFSDEEIAAVEKKSAKQSDVLVALREAGEKAVAVADLCEQCGVAHQTVQSMAKKGWLLVEPEKVERDPFGKEQFVSSGKLELNDEQRTVFARVAAAVDAVAGATTAMKPFLLHGVTGSGKTEIYLQGIDRALEQGMGAILLVPEISLTPQTVERFKSRFAATNHEVAVLHSHLSEGERHDEWHRIRSGRARIVIGARSAVFAPVERLGIIIVDEEHENTYKQEETPRYHGRDLAVVRGHFEKCVVLLGSATPSLESAYNAQTGKYELLKLTMRVDDQKMPFIRIVDMRMEAKKSSPIVSDPLSKAITERLAKKEQVILFLNRRGFSTTLLCNKCGYVAECPNCSVSLTFHRAANRIVCHMCGHLAIAPTQCPDCKDPGIKYSGTGTEKVEDTVQKFFPDAVVKRMDADMMQKKESYRETLNAFRAGKIDILVGTQMIAKGLHFPNVTLVGIVNADMGLHLPDFRASERTFQLLTQVAGRAGRGDVSGEVVVQSYTPFHPAIQFARHHDFDGFYEQEIEWREKMVQPPFTHFVLITVRSPHEERAKLSIETLHRRLKEVLPAGVTLGEPAPAPLEKSHGNFRFHLSLRSRAVLKLSRAIRSVLDKLPMPEDVFAVVDVDAHQLL
ncbi:MAG: primosomal protein [Verrucomicrobiota bacterium]|jgi:primosomal protein N' (replication factor Y)